MLDTVRRMLRQAGMAAAERVEVADELKVPMAPSPNSHQDWSTRWTAIARDLDIRTPT